MTYKHVILVSSLMAFAIVSFNAHECDAIIEELESSYGIMKNMIYNMRENENEMIRRLQKLYDKATNTIDDLTPNLSDALADFNESRRDWFKYVTDFLLDSNNFPLMQRPYPRPPHILPYPYPNQQ